MFLQDQAAALVALARQWFCLRLNLREMFRNCITATDESMSHLISLKTPLDQSKLRQLSAILAFAISHLWKHNK